MGATRKQRLSTFWAKYWMWFSFALRTVGFYLTNLMCLLFNRAGKQLYRRGSDEVKNHLDIITCGVMGFTIYVLPGCVQQDYGNSATGLWKFRCSLKMTMSLLWQWGMIQVVCCRKVSWKAGDMQGTRMRFLSLIGILYVNEMFHWRTWLHQWTTSNCCGLGWIACSASKKGHNLLSLELTRITETKHLPFGQLKAEYEHCQLKTVWGRHGSNDWALSELSIECGFILRCGQLDSISQKKMCLLFNRAGKQLFRRGSTEVNVSCVRMSFACLVWG